MKKYCQAFSANKMLLSGSELVQAKARFRRDGFIKVKEIFLDDQIDAIRGRFEALFNGVFESGVYPDEWHWRRGISKENAFREIVNGWKCDSVVKDAVRSERIGKMCSLLMDWKSGTRLAQDDILWKPPLAKGVQWHQDSAYISNNFSPREDNSLTVWIALDDADEETGVVEYVPGSHRWHLSIEQDETKSKNIKSLPTSAVSSTFHGQDAEEIGPQNTLYRAAVAANKDPHTLDIVKLNVEAGSAIIHHQDVWHGSGKSISTSRHRRALGVHLLRRDVQWRQDGKPVDYIYGRYVLPDTPDPSSVFFPVVFEPKKN